MLSRPHGTDITAWKRVNRHNAINHMTHAENARAMPLKYETKPCEHQGDSRS
jgi:hypothetical protein